MFVFGSGVCIVTPSGGTPVNVGLLQGITIDESVTLKEAHGQYQDALAIGAGTRKRTGKATVARFSGLVLASIFYGIVPVAGQIGTAFAEAAPVPTTLYQVTVANAATFIQDQGVTYALGGLPLKLVPSAPTVGQYSVVVATGVYTFAAADVGKGMLISYNYGITGTGQKIIMANQLIGPTVTFGLNLSGVDPNTGVTYGVQYPNCVSSKFGFATKLEDFVVPEFDFSMFANTSGIVGTWSFGEGS